MDRFKNIYFLGIGGIGMSALARYFLLEGANITGYDRTPSDLTDALIREGMQIHFRDDISLIPENVDLVIYTPAIPNDHKEFLFLRQNGTLMKKRSEVLGMITSDAETIAVAGTHGKTTISTMIAHILETSGMNFTAFLGGISKNYQTNFLHKGSSTDAKKRIVVEADEYDRSFLTLYPDYAVITSVDADHLDIYQNKNLLRESFCEFTCQIKKNGHLVVKKDLALEPDNKNGFAIHPYGMNSGEYCAENVQIKNGKYLFDLHHVDAKIITEISLGLPGFFNVENAVAAAAIADLMGIPAAKIKEALESYQGVRRRFDYQIRRDDFVFIDDYAHHPAEIKACIDAVKRLYPGEKITGVFQPHLFSRTRDFADEFAVSLGMLDNLILLEIYPAREIPLPGVDAKMLLDKVQLHNKKICTKEELIPELMKNKPKILITMGAGDIDRLVDPINEAFKAPIR